MSKWRVTGPDGVIRSVEANSKDEAIRLGQQQSRAPAAPSRATAPTKPASEVASRQEDRDPGTFLSRSAGLAQGAILDPIEELGRFIEHATNTKIAPDVIRDKLKSFRSSVRSTQQGRIAEGIGNIAGTALPFGAVGKVASVPGLVSGVVRGGLSAGLQPLEGSNDYMSDKAAQVGLGMLTGGAMESPLARQVASWLATRGAIHGAGAALMPHQWWTHYPLHHLAQNVYRRIPPVIGRVVGNPYTVSGATTGLGAAMGRDDTAAPPPSAPPPAAPPPSASRPATSGAHIHYGGWTTKDQEDDE
jgi:hypothetical protein